VRDVNVTGDGAPLPAATAIGQFAAEVVEYLERTPRQLPSKYLYDPLGSALFEAICRLPWYRITRAERTLLERHAVEILHPLPRPFSVAELGCGSGEKLARLLEGGAAACRRVALVDISGEALLHARDRLAEVPAEEIRLHQTGYEDGLAAIAAERDEAPMLMLFLGSNIGNFDPPADGELLARIRATLRPGDWFLLGADLVKPERRLLLAYDDPLGVTAAFNRNLLRRINDELGGTFDLDAFAHRAVWNIAESRVEMHLVSLVRQTVRIAASQLEVVFAAGEYIWTESSYKYESDAVTATGLAAGFTSARQWIDPDAGFALTRFAV
jgi:dimethylhistidine N-methyltransferase